RYMGAAFIGAAGLALFLFGRGEDRRFKLSIGRRELAEAVPFAVVSILPILAWFMVDLSITGTLGSRSGQPAAAYWQRFLEMGPALQKIYLFWLIPDSVSARLPGILQLAAWLIPLICIFGLVVLLSRRMRSTSQASVQAPALRLAGLFLMFTAVYLLVLAVAQVFTYPPITLASRMLSPVHLAFLVWFPLLLIFAARVLSHHSRLIIALVGLGLLAFLATYALRSALIARDYHAAGIGYNARTWRSSGTLEALKNIPPDVPLISNEVTAIMYLAGRPAYTLQEIYQDRPVEPFTVYGAGEDESQQVFRQKNAALVLFKANLHEDFAMYGAQVDNRLAVLTNGLYVYFENEDGAIYFSRQPDFAPPGQ
ncbi:MAG: hypothetical protein IH586_04460, partial [Anaerolineaceae bacterium]|nr:hypothetical protein [Anaerolineaceae bacterium]